MGESNRSKYDALPFEDVGKLVLMCLRDKGARTDNAVIYEGYAKPGTLTSAASWTIVRTFYDASSSGFCLGTDVLADFNQIWDNRYTLSFYLPATSVTGAGTCGTAGTSGTSGNI